jgi:hypothetical protein
MTWIPKHDQSDYPPMQLPIKLGHSIVMNISSLTVANQNVRLFRTFLRLLVQMLDHVIPS